MTFTPLSGVRAPSHTISPLAVESVGSAHTVWMNGFSAGTGTADRVYYVPFEIAQPFTVKEVGWYNGASVGNGTVEVGVYGEDGTKLVSCTATTTAGASVNQVVDVTDTTLGAPARYYMAFVSHHATDSFIRNNSVAGLWESMGIMQQSSQSSLPATATFATMATAYMPIFYVTGHTLL